MKNFVVITESTRVKGKIIGSLYKIQDNQLRRISDFGYSKQSNRGALHEAVKALVTFGALPGNKIDSAGMLIPERKNYNIFIIEGQGLNYTTEHRAQF